MTNKATVRNELYSYVCRERMWWFYPIERCEKYLLEKCPGCHEDIKLLISAAQVDVVSEMRRLNGRMYPELLLRKSISWLVRQTDVTTEEATWVIETWAMALEIGRY